MHDQQKAYRNSKPLTDAEIDKRASERAELVAKMQATREKAFANFYNNVLTPEQRAQYDKQRAAGPGPGSLGGGNGGYCRGGGPGRGWGMGPGMGWGSGR
jgi:hypothetical protein